MTSSFIGRAVATLRRRRFGDVGVVFGVVFGVDFGVDRRGPGAAEPPPLGQHFLIGPTIIQSARSDHIQRLQIRP